MTERSGPGRLARARTLARLAVLAAAGAVAVLLLLIGKAGLLVPLVGLLGLAVTAAAVWWALTHHGLLRLGGALVAVAVPVTVVVLYATTGVWIPVLGAVALWALALQLARSGLHLVRPPRPMRGHRTPRPERPVLIMNPRSGGGKVARFGLAEQARRLGARVVVLDPAVKTDVAELARQAVADGADLLGVAGGDGTQALVAAVAAEHDLPFLVISAGTRNHFAMDLGLDRTDPSTCLDALTNGEELRVDLGAVAGLPFVNTVSFGAYAEIVQSPEYRDAKVGTALEALPDLLLGAGARLNAQADDVRLEGQQALLISNNAYTGGDPLAAGRRQRLDTGLLGVFGIRVEGAVQAAEIALRGARASGLRTLTAREVVVGPGTGGTGTDATAADAAGTGTGTGTSEAAEGLAVAVDGEALRLTPPVRCEIRPRALRVRVPVHRPGAPVTSLPLDWNRLIVLALGRPLSPDHDTPST
ncbi:diacylglycerol kinase family protein [Kitasatospora sp. NPDC047058]|uniref:diacylglycerol/lipid kinase family protein n=1 Tax=Kitasatospora sp. NPDC047058 TaxID=3155620 RepID=UPI0033F04184